MGSTQCKPCCAEEQKDAQLITFDTMPVISQAVQADKAGFMNGELEGKWWRKGDQCLLGNIKGSFMVWEKIYQHPPSALTANGSDCIRISLEGETHEGKIVYSPGARPFIRWSDGEIWTRERG
eukprot:TRINITY_DN71347_c0_g1_i1.p1 TRINITY_DN71347_c0_g1~~TRINITY_DN71347_c0_g1_i1.p1  ORF type:complete len:123 (-),score=26.63 TRINITY_DN71347_c0_g1_i1:39-407(-)